MAYPQSIAHCTSEETSLGETMIDNQISITLTDEALKALASLGRTDLPPTLAIDLACDMYPWLKHLLNELQAESQDIVRTRTDALFLEGLDLGDEVVTETNERVSNYCRRYHGHPDGGSCTD